MCEPSDGYWASREEAERDAWAADPACIDLTASYAEWIGGELPDSPEVAVFETAVRDFRESGRHPHLSDSELKRVTELQERLFEDRDGFLAKYRIDEWIELEGDELDNHEGYCQFVVDAELIGAAERVAELDRAFWPRVREVGMTPGLMRAANALLHPTHFSASSDDKDFGVRVVHRRPCARERASRGSSSRTRGSRRVASRAAGGGRSDPDEPEPARGWHSALDLARRRARLGSVGASAGELVR